MDYDSVFSFNEHRRRLADSLNGDAEEVRLWRLEEPRPLLVGVDCCSYSVVSSSPCLLKGNKVVEVGPGLLISNYVTSHS